jgi:hypothetical protein
MEKKNTPQEAASMTAYDALEDWTRIRVQEYIQELLEEEVTVFLGRRKSPRAMEGTQTDVAMDLASHVDSQ